MFIMLEKMLGSEKTVVVGVNVNLVNKVEPGLQSSRGEQTTRIYYSNGQSDVVTGQVERTLERLNNDADVTSLR
jgi:hypothetical protein